MRTSYEGLAASARGDDTAVSVFTNPRWLT